MYITVQLVAAAAVAVRSNLICKVEHCIVHIHTEWHRQINRIISKQIDMFDSMTVLCATGPQADYIHRPLVQAQCHMHGQYVCVSVCVWLTENGPSHRPKWLPLNDHSLGAQA